MEIALYDSERGFYETGGAAGRGGDFLTSPEVGPLFGAVLARALDRWWRDAGRPSVWTVVEVGAGVGTLARAVISARPECTGALRYVLVERSAALRRRQLENLPVDDVHTEVAPVLVSRPDLPSRPICGVIFANELLDNLGFRLLQRGSEAWSEVVAVSTPSGELTEGLAPAPTELATVAEARAPDSAPGARVPIAVGAVSWFREALALIEPGRLVAVDYGASTADLACRAPDEWLRTYSQHGPGSPPLADLGTQDITCEVPWDQLTAIRPAAHDRSQVEFLTAHGINDLVTDAREVWYERAAVGDLEAFAARSRVGEAEALLDPDGLGAFRVVEWVVD